MKRILQAVAGVVVVIGCLFSVFGFQEIINGARVIYGKLTASNINSTRVVDGVTFTTIQAAITDACASSPHASVFVPTGVYPQNSAFTLCSNLYVFGAGSNGPATTGGTEITTTMTSGTLVQLGGLTNVHFSDLWIHSTALSGTSVAIGDATGTNSTTWTQGDVGERFYVDGGFLKGIDLEVFNASVGSTITNSFRDFQVTITLAASIACDLNSNDATVKVINANIFQNGVCNGGSGASFGLRTIGGAGGAGLYVINENLFNDMQFYTGNGGGSIGINLMLNSTSDLTFIAPTIEGNATGIFAAAGVQAVCISCDLTVNGTPITDPNFNVTFIGGRGPTLTGKVPPRVVASGVATMGNSSLTAGTCSSPVIGSAPGTLTTDRVTWSWNLNPTDAHDGLLIVQAWPTADNVNFKQCNPGAGTVPRDSITLNWAVIR